VAGRSNGNAVVAPGWPHGRQQALYEGGKSVVKSSGSYRQKTAMAKICHFVGQQPKNRLDLRRAFD
jgi:hypothetical protein